MYDPITDPARRYLNAIRRIVRQNAMHLIDVRVALPEEDMKRATDFVVVVTGGEVAVRIRDHKHRLMGRNDFTVRSRTIYGNRNTELAKLQTGFGRFYLYAWESVDQSDLAEWVFVDLDQWRRAEAWKGWIEVVNGDGSAFIPMPFWFLQETGCVASASEHGVEYPASPVRYRLLKRREARLAPTLFNAGTT